MKFALNGALTVGTLDGANIEIGEAVGDENIFIFGRTADEVADMRVQGYRPWDFYNEIPELKRTIDMISSGFFNADDPDRYKPIADALLFQGDHYFLLADFDAYIGIQKKVEAAYRDRPGWIRKAIFNVSNMGKFSSDRSIHEYARTIWKIQPVP